MRWSRSQRLSLTLFEHWKPLGGRRSPTEGAVEGDVSHLWGAFGPRVEPMDLSENNG